VAATKRLTGWSRNWRRLRSLARLLHCAPEEIALRKTRPAPGRWPFTPCVLLPATASDAANEYASNYIVPAGASVRGRNSRVESDAAESGSGGLRNLLDDRSS